MEPEFEGFCIGCNSYDEHLRFRIAINNNSGRTVAGLFCPICRKRFNLGKEKGYKNE